MQTPLQTLAIGLVFALSLVSCSKQKQETDLVAYPLKGKVVEVDTAGRTITISHEAIPDFMMAMTMPFKVKNPALFERVAPGDSVKATLAVSRAESWLETLAVTSKGEETPTLTAMQIVLNKVFKPGEPFPDETLVNQEGKKIRFSDFRGKTLALTFIYTRCPLPDFCIRMSDQFATLQKKLSADKTAAGSWHMITISFDPKFDSPEILKQYGKNYGAEFSTWDFATDPDTAGSAIMRLADGLGLTYAADGGLIAHNLRTAVIDRNGCLVKVISGNSWKPDELAKMMRQ